ncbi:hypothetical protein [Streptomyces sp. NPDC093094]|uniref:hypothetical protein n=1 Tax=Streptomyces sp. NPDC093094 TaxID=3366026 RepID=UPI003824AC00
MNAAFTAAVGLSLFSAVAYAAAAVAQERLAARSAGGGLLRLLGTGAWWGAVLLNAAAALLHVVALRYGPLTVVQPLGALTLVAAVPLGARVAGRRVSRDEWRGTAFTLAGLAVLLAAASGPAPDDVLHPAEALAVAGTAAALIGLLSRPGARPGLRHATASGVASGVASALTQTVTVAATDRTGPVLGLQVIGVAVLVAAFAAGGLLLSQTAYRGGLGAPLATVTLANPVAAALIGLSLLGERLRGGPAGVLTALAGAALASWGVVQLSRGTRRDTERAVPGPAAAAGAGERSAAPALDALVPPPPPEEPVPASVSASASAPDRPVPTGVTGGSGRPRPAGTTWLPGARTRRTARVRRRRRAPAPQTEPVDTGLVA